jgi:hypothetical protein
MVITGQFLRMVWVAQARHILCLGLSRSLMSLKKVERYLKKSKHNTESFQGLSETLLLSWTIKFKKMVRSSSWFSIISRFTKKVSMICYRLNQVSQITSNLAVEGFWMRWQCRCKAQRKYSSIFSRRKTRFKLHRRDWMNVVPEVTPSWFLSIPN